MRDWRQYVRERLPLPEMKVGRAEGIVDELASQLEDLYEEAVSRGASEEAADARARELISDWGGLASDILKADRSSTVTKLDRWFDAVVVGVVDDVRQYGLEAEVLREIYFPFSRSFLTEKWLVVRAALDPLSLVPSISRELSEIDADLPLSGVRTMDELYRGSASGRRFMTLLVGLFAVLALVLVAAGLYGVMSFNVTQRRHEIGVRLAFGAENNQILKLMLRRGIRLAVLGSLIGVGCAIGAARIIGNMLYGVSATNPVSFVGVVLLLAIVALLASLLPALRATTVDPVRVLQTGH
ncbi:MAG: FtsX-like permease family protein [Gemmatimonadota bacterium]|nr:MAG: FtsX-like permease family protein [Gemmatimonadota bacterium]